MRDIALLLVLIAIIPRILKQPWVGIIAWVVVSVMNPHRLTYGFAYSLPIAMIVLAATLTGMLFSRDGKKVPIDGTTILLILFVLWMNVTTAFALYPADAFAQWIKVMKIMFVVFLGMTLLQTRQHLTALVWAIVFSIGFFGVKGGIFAALTGGGYKIYGPPESDIGDNNAISFALVVIMPFMYYLMQTTGNKWIKRGMAASMVFCALAVLASHSRGAFLALAIMSFFLWMKSDKKLWLGIAFVVAAPLLIMFMPDEWTARMGTIQSYDQDASSMGRINTWWMCFNLANSRPLVGGGFQIYEAASFARWAPDPLDIHAAHSIYFAALGEHGYVGLLLFLMLGIAAWISAGRVVRKTKKVPELMWATLLARMVQVSLLGYAIGGAFLSVLYFDVLYYIIALVPLLNRAVAQEQAPAGAVNPPLAVVRPR